MKTVKFFLLSIFFFQTIPALFAQDALTADDKKDKIEAMKISFLTKRLNLSSAEAKAFWPVYNQYETELATLRRNYKQERQQSKEDLSTISDREIEKIVDAEITFRQSEIDILKKYHAQFKQMLPIRKVAMLYKAEEDFKRELLKQIRERQ